jgi:site-specific recombinase XerD
MDRPKWEGHPTLARETEFRVSGAMLHQYARSLKTFGGWLQREGYAPANPLGALRMPKVDQRELVPLSEEDERILVGAYDDNTVTGCRIKALFLLMLDTGLRLSEVVDLKDEAVDLEQGYLVVLGKGGKERAVPFGFTTQKVLRKYVTIFRPEPSTPAVDRFFRSPNGDPLTDQAIKMVFARARERTGIRRLHPHLLRHTYGIRAQEHDMPSMRIVSACFEGSGVRSLSAAAAEGANRWKSSRPHALCSPCAATRRSPCRPTW